jgi:CheY-like chemotaxis protein
MDQKLKCILLVDDDEATNFIHKVVLRQARCTENIVTSNNGQEALEFLQTSSDGIYPNPDLILLDINMPVMNGWEFLMHYEAFDPASPRRKIIVMLTTSLPAADRAKAEGIKAISGYMNKPLTSESVRELLKKHFSEFFKD